MKDDSHSFKMRALKMRKMSDEADAPDVKLRFKKIADRWLDLYYSYQDDTQK